MASRLNGVCTERGKAGRESERGAADQESSGAQMTELYIDHGGVGRWMGGPGWKSLPWEGEV